MNSNSCTAREIADLLGLNYHTFLARVKRGKYTVTYFGRSMVFDKETVFEEHKRWKDRSESLVGKKFGKLRVIEGPISKKIKNGNRVRFYTCECLCGRMVEVRGTHLTSGHTKSCGKKHYPDRPPKQHPIEYQIWEDIRARCLRPSHPLFHSHGKKGVVVCHRWHIFQNFLEDVGVAPSPNHFLIRYPNSAGDYRPDNVKWEEA